MKRSLASRLSLAATVSFMGLGLISCAPTITNHGYLPIDAVPSKDIKIGDSRVVVLDKLGTPSQTSNFDPLEWYYIDQNIVKMTYKPAKVSSRNITLVRFDQATQNVVEVTNLTYKDGRIITPDPAKTPTRGRSLTALEQILGTVGAQRLPNENDNPSQRRRE